MLRGGRALEAAEPEGVGSCRDWMLLWLMEEREVLKRGLERLFLLLMRLGWGEPRN